jgi:hypothetical protein
MHSITETATALVASEPLGFLLWLEFAVLPVLVPLVVALARRQPFRQCLNHAWATAARTVGYPAAIILLLGVPWVAFELFLVPVLLDAYPGSQVLLSVPLTFTHWLLSVWFWLVPLLWPVWVVAVAFFDAHRASATLERG